MALTPAKAWPYSGPNDVPDVPYWLQRIAEKGDAVQVALEAKDTDAALRRYAEYTMTSGLDSNPGSGHAWGSVGYTADAAKTFNNDFIKPRTAGPGLEITRAGVYAITALFLPATDPGQVATGLHLNGSGAPIAHHHRANTYGNWEATVTHPGLYLTVGQYFDFITANSSGAIFGGRVYIHRTGN